jgi:mannosylglycerate hydrolase MGH1-like protein
MSPETLPQARHWSTWDAARPAEFMHLPAGLRVTPVVYSASSRTATHFPPGPNVVLGPHASDSSFVGLTLSHAGTSLDWLYFKPDPATVAGSWSTKALGEWGLRLWVALCFSAEGAKLWRFDPDKKTLYVESADGYFAVACREPPLLVTAHPDLVALEQELESRGYWYLGSRAVQGPFLVCRFNLEQMPSNRFAVAHAGSLAEAQRQAGKALDASPPRPRPASDSLSAVRDIIAWNTVWDPKNKRPYTSCSRNWDLEKFGGFGVWLTDTAVSALACSLFDEDQARQNLEALLAGQTPQGNFPCLVTGNDSWLDRSQPPLVSLIVWLIYSRTRSRSLIEWAYDPLLRNHQWWWRTRDGNGNTMLEYGSSNIGEGLYIGTKLAAKNESFMDNSPVHDEAQWNDRSRTLDCEDVGLNSLIALDAEMLGHLASALGRHEDSKAHHRCAEAHRDRVSAHFWDRSRGIFANRLWNGKFVQSLSPASFFPLLIGAANPRQIASLLRHLANPRMFGGKWGLPSVARNDPAFRDNVYWRGRIWPILNWLVWLGLKRNGLAAAAETLRKKSHTLFTHSWQSRLAPENFNATTGKGLDQPDTDPFYSWTVLLPLMSLAQLIDIDPWNGCCLRTTGEDTELGPINTPIGPVHIARRRGWIEIRQAAKLLFATNVTPGITHLEINDRITLLLPAGLGKGRKLRTAKTIASAIQNGRPLPLASSGDDLRLRMTGPKPELLEVDFAG